MSKLATSVLAGCTLIALLGCAPEQQVPAPQPEVAPEITTVSSESEPMVAMSTLQAVAEGAAGGTVVFTQVGETVAVVADVTGLSPGTHGFHVHETGDCSAADFTSAGGHFNPTDAPHGAPTDAARHAGDLGNIEVDEDGRARLELSSDMLTVSEGPHSVVGRAVIVHEVADDLVSQPTGAAGGRIACGVVEFVPAVRGMEAEGTTGEGTSTQ